MPENSDTTRGSGALFQFKPLGKLYWSRFLFAIIAAIFCGILGLTNVIGVATGLLFYVVSYASARYLLKISPEEVGGMRTLYSKGIGTYIFAWITIWTLLYTLLS